ncbi:uncharacterized protein [Ambystoma mexicanum]|uniref:uncharacterized protein n=1 Tax=Ambystoma mexicanum TaxID=8296 RepID=UPI0037E84EF6
MSYQASTAIPAHDVIEVVLVDEGLQGREIPEPSATGRGMDAQSWAEFMALTEVMGWQAAMARMGGPVMSRRDENAVHATDNINIGNAHASSSGENPIGGEQSMPNNGQEPGAPRKRTVKTSGGPHHKKTKRDLEEELAALKALLGAIPPAPTVPPKTVPQAPHPTTPAILQPIKATVAKDLGQRPTEIPAPETPAPRNTEANGESELVRTITRVVTGLLEKAGRSPPAANDIGTTASGASNVWRGTGATGGLTRERAIGTPATPGQGEAGAGPPAKLPAATGDDYSSWLLPGRVKQQIWDGKFIDLLSLLEHEMEGEDTLHDIGGRETVKARKRVRPAKTLANWLAAFKILAQTIHLKDPSLSPALMGYRACVIQEHNILGGNEWFLRDQRFRLRMAHDPDLKWVHKSVEDWLGSTRGTIEQADGSIVFTGGRGNQLEITHEGLMLPGSLYKKQYKSNSSFNPQGDTVSSLSIQCASHCSSFFVTLVLMFIV